MLRFVLVSMVFLVYQVVSRVTLIIAWLLISNKVLSKVPEIVWIHVSVKYRQLTSEGTVLAPYPVLHHNYCCLQYE